MNSARHLTLRGERQFRAPLWAAVTAAALLTSSVAAQHNTDMWVAQAGGAVVLSSQGLVPGTRYHPLLRTDVFRGWSHNNPGFDRLTVNFGDERPLPPGSEIWLEVVDLDLAFIIVAHEILEFPSDSTFLGVHNDLHAHLTWFVEERAEGFDPEQCVWEITFRLFDLGAGLIDSAEYTLLFTNVPVRGGSFPAEDVPASGDFDGDQVVDILDYAAFATCLFGPGQRPAPSDPAVTTCEVECHNAHDFDDDLDVDLLDFAEFQVQSGL